MLLAGGRSSRVGGGDKCLLQLRGKPLLAHAIERLKPQVDALVLNANGDPKRFASFGLPVIADHSDEHAGPLAGLLAGMEWADAEAPNMRFIVTVPTDTPFLPEDLVARLVEAQQGREVPAIAASIAASIPCSAFGRSHSLPPSGTTSLQDCARRSTGRMPKAR